MLWLLPFLKSKLKSYNSRTLCGFSAGGKKILFFATHMVSQNITGISELRCEEKCIQDESKTNKNKNSYRAMKELM